MNFEKSALRLRRLLPALALISLTSITVPAAAFAAVPLITNTATVTADNGFTATGDGTSTVTTSVAGIPVPTLSSVGLVALTVLLAGFAVYRLRRQAGGRFSSR